MLILFQAKEDLEDNKEAGKRAQNILKTEMDSLSEKLVRYILENTFNYYLKHEQQCLIST